MDKYDQRLFRDSKDSKCFININHPEHNTSVKSQKAGKGERSVKENDKEEHELENK